MPAATLTTELPGDRSATPPSLGWFGKIPAAGDFINRRLPNDFLQPWDEWLQSGIARGRSVLEARWDEVYLTFPVWRFLLPAGTGSQGHWAGVLMPSVDRVGRHFPLTVAAPIH